MYVLVFLLCIALILNFYLFHAMRKQAKADREVASTMSRELEEQIETITQQRNEHLAVLSSLLESVFAVGLDEKILSINPAGESLLGIESGSALGRQLPEVVRNYRLQELFRESLRSEGVVEGDVTLYEQNEKIVELYGTSLNDAQGEKLGAFIVLNDVTQVRRLERVRKDFVANVSHELRTPLTSIKGFVETLLEGAIERKEDARRFLEIANRHVDRLNAIIENLLNLSRIEEGTERKGLEVEMQDIDHVVRSALRVCETKAEEKEVRLELERTGEMMASVNSGLLEEAIVNLVDNAIKYSERGDLVRIRLKDSESEFAVEVEDEGCGVSSEHMNRIFERFYRVDQGRSRKEGGAGLGLAIVKHVALAHRGRVNVSSNLGKGSTFSLHFPKTL